MVEGMGYVAHIRGRGKERQEKERDPGYKARRPRLFEAVFLAFKRCSTVRTYFPPLLHFLLAVFTVVLLFSIFSHFTLGNIFQTHKCRILRVETRLGSEKMASPFFATTFLIKPETC